MDVKRVHEILKECTTVFRKGEMSIREDIESKTSGEKGVVIHHYGYPHASEATDIPTYDVHFVVVGVIPEKAKDHEEELRQILNDYPKRYEKPDEVGYIELGAELDSQEAALRLFAMGENLGWWETYTPERVVPDYPDIWDMMAGGGFITVKGLRDL